MAIVCYFSSNGKLCFDLLWNVHADYLRRNFLYFPEFITNNFRWLYSTSSLAWIPANKCPFQEDYLNERRYVCTMRLLSLSVTAWSGGGSRRGSDTQRMMRELLSTQGDAWHLVTENIFPCVLGIRVHKAKQLRTLEKNHDQKQGARHLVVG